MKAYTNTVDTFVAEDEVDLKHQFEKMYGPHEDFENENTEFEWKELPEEQDLSIWFYESDFDLKDKNMYPLSSVIEYDEDRNVFTVTMTVKQWIDYTGKGFLCSTEY